MPAAEDDSLFGDVISSYSRREAIEDGVLVQLSGPGYEGETWIPEMVAEAGIKFPVAVTASVFHDCIEVTPAAKRACNDIKGRLWDVLWLLRLAIKAAGNTDTIHYRINCVADRRRVFWLKSVCGPDDDGSPCITIMKREED